MTNYLLIDLVDERLTKVVADSDIEALCKAIKGLINDKIITLEEVCEDLNIKIKDITNIYTYE
jgi:hypothetical protein